MSLRRLRPPGALPEADFLRACTKCDDCLVACPARCIVRVPDGEPDARTPILLPASRACVLCSNLACTHACAPGALRPLSSWREVRIGLAQLDPALCVAWSGTACTVCRDACPAEPKAIELEGGRPRVRFELCTGCGLCEERCPTRPRAIWVQPLARAGAGPGSPPRSGSIPSPT